MSEWHFFGDKKPPEHKMVNVFRQKNEKYMHAFYNVHLPGPNEEDPEESIPYCGWVTQHGNFHRTSDSDAWQEFEYFKMPASEKVYDGRPKWAM